MALKPSSASFISLSAPYRFVWHASCWKDTSEEKKSDERADLLSQNIPPSVRGKNKAIFMSGKPSGWRTGRIAAPGFKLFVGQGALLKKKPRQWVIGCLMNCIGRPCSVEGWVCHRALGSHSRAGLYWLSLCICGHSFTSTDAADQPCGRMETFSWAH